MLMDRVENSQNEVVLTQKRYYMLGFICGCHFEYSDVCFICNIHRGQKI